MQVSSGFDPWVWKTPWRRKWQPTPVFLSGKSHGQRSLQYFQTVVLEDTTESPLDFKQIKLVQDPMDCSTPDFPVFHYCELESMGSQRVGHDLATEITRITTAKAIDNILSRIL